MKNGYKKMMSSTMVVTSLFLSGCSVNDYTYDIKSNVVDNMPVEKEEVINTETYSTYSLQQDTFYSELMKTTQEDRMKITEYYSLPELERMSEEDAKTYLSDVKVLDIMSSIDIDVDILQIPEYNWKKNYNDVIGDQKDAFEFNKELQFIGENTSELNKLIIENPNTIINIVKDMLIVDEPINIAVPTYIKGKNTKLHVENKQEVVLEIVDIKNVKVEGIIVEGNFEKGIKVHNSSNILIKNNYIVAGDEAINIQKSESVSLINNAIYNSKIAAISLETETSKCIIEGNMIYHNGEDKEFISAINVENINADTLSATMPNNIIIRKNSIQGTNGQGISISGSYMVYVIDNEILENRLEGILIDSFSFGNYISGNKISGNGIQSSEVTDKLSGITVDNSAYNWIKGNTITENYGSGIKMRKAVLRNIIIQNTISDNNIGQSEQFHGFGIELGNEEYRDGVKGDFIPSYENIICRNIITGSHYAGIFLAEESYINDIFDNIIMDSRLKGIEDISGKLNNQLNNISNDEI